MSMPPPPPPPPPPAASDSGSQASRKRSRSQVSISETAIRRQRSRTFGPEDAMVAVAPVKAPEAPPPQYTAIAPPVTMAPRQVQIPVRQLFAPPPPPPPPPIVAPRQVQAPSQSQNYVAQAHTMPRNGAHYQVIHNGGMFPPQNLTNDYSPNSGINCITISTGNGPYARLFSLPIQGCQKSPTLYSLIQQSPTTHISLPDENPSMFNLLLCYLRNGVSTHWPPEGSDALAQLWTDADAVTTPRAAANIADVLKKLYILAETYQLPSLQKRVVQSLVVVSRRLDSSRLVHNVAFDVYSAHAGCRNVPDHTRAWFVHTPGTVEFLGDRSCPVREVVRCLEAGGDLALDVFVRIETYGKKIVPPVPAGASDVQAYWNSEHQRAGRSSAGSVRGSNTNTAGSLRAAASNASLNSSAAAGGGGVRKKEVVKKKESGTAMKGKKDPTK